MIRRLLPVAALLIAASGTAYAQTVTLPPSGDNQRSRGDPADRHGAGVDRIQQPRRACAERRRSARQDLGHAGAVGHLRSRLQQPQGAVARRREREHRLHRVASGEDQRPAAARRAIRAPHARRRAASGPSSSRRTSTSWGSFSYDAVGRRAARDGEAGEGARIASGSPTTSSIASPIAPPSRCSGKSCACRSRSPSTTCRRSTSTTCARELRSYAGFTLAGVAGGGAVPACRRTATWTRR